MKFLIVKRDDDQDIQFTGKCIGSVSSNDRRACNNYSGKPGNWSDFNLYQTYGGMFVCERVDYSRYQGDRTRYYGDVCVSLGEVMDFFGTDKFARELYDSAGIDYPVY